MAFAPAAMAAMAIASAVASAAGAIMGGIGAAQAGKANKQLMNQAALQRQQQGAIAANRVRKQQEQLRGAQMAAFASQGIDVFSESPLEILAETAKEYEWRANATKWQGEAEATELRNKGQLAAWQGKVARNASYAQAAAALFKGGATAFSAMPSGSPSGVSLNPAQADALVMTGTTPVTTSRWERPVY